MHPALLHLLDHGIGHLFALRPVPLLLIFVQRPVEIEHTALPHSFQHRRTSGPKGSQNTHEHRYGHRGQYDR